MSNGTSLKNFELQPIEETREPNANRNRKEERESKVADLGIDRLRVIFGGICRRPE